MEVYDYIKEEKQDILNYCRDNGISLKQEDLADKLWDVDEITGNQSAYDTEEKCMEYLMGNFSLIKEAMESFGYEIKDINTKNPTTWLDTLIRCYLLQLCIDELKNEENIE